MENTNSAKNIKAVVFDSIGVLFSAAVVFDPEKGEVLRTRSHQDGQGISFLRAAGIHVAFASASDDGFIRALEKRLNGLPSVVSGAWKPISVFAGVTTSAKKEAVEKWLKEISVSWEECAFMGDDRGDYESLLAAGFRAVPQDAEDMVKEKAHFIAKRNGGNGAVRDLVNHLLKEKNIDPATLALF